MPSATSTKSEFGLDQYSNIEPTLDDLDDDILEIVEQQIIAFRTWYSSHPQMHNKGPVAYELLSQIMDE